MRRRRPAWSTRWRGSRRGGLRLWSPSGPSDFDEPGEVAERVGDDPLDHVLIHPAGRVDMHLDRARPDADPSRRLAARVAAWDAAAAGPVHLRGGDAAGPGHGGRAAGGVAHEPLREALMLVPVPQVGAPGDLMPGALLPRAPAGLDIAALPAV